MNTKPSFPGKSRETSGPAARQNLSPTTAFPDPLAKKAVDHASFHSGFVVLAFMAFLAVPRALAFAPPVGQINSQVTLLASPPAPSGLTLNRQVLNNPERIRYTLDRPAPLADVVFERTRPNGATQFSVEAAFVGANGLVFKVLSSDNVAANRSAFFLDRLAAGTPAEVTLFDRQVFETDSALPFFFRNADGSCLFVDMQSNRSGELQHNVFVMTVFRMDTGAGLCTHETQVSDRGDIFSATIPDTGAPTGSDVRIRRDRQQFADIDKTCELPLPANLVITSQQPLAFGAIVNNNTSNLPVRFSNPGGDPMQVTLVASVQGHFVPLNLEQFTLLAGGTAERTIQFRPGGANGPFNENVRITRNPAVGADVVQCTGSGTTPLPTVSITANDSQASEPGTNTGQFTVTRTGSTANAMTVNLGITGTATPGTATSGADYVTLATSKTIPAGSSSASITVTAMDDTKNEPAQTVILTLLAGAGYAVGAPNSATVSITDNDPLPEMKIVGRSFFEGFTAVRIVADVTLLAPSERQVTVKWDATPTILFGRFGEILTSTANGFDVCGIDPNTSLVADFARTKFPQLLTFPPGTVAQTVSVTICTDSFAEQDETFFIKLSTPVNATLAITSLRAGDAICTIRNDDLETGSFDLTPGDPVVRVNQRLTYAFSWTVPEPLNWHDLRDLQLRIRQHDDRDDVHGGGEHGRRGEHGRGHDKDDADAVLWLKFDETSSTFSVFNEAAGRFGPTAAAGSNKRLETHSATLHMAETSVVGSGPTGPSVTLNLSLSFKPRAVGRTCLVEVAASDDFGRQDDFTQAGTLTIQPGVATQPNSVPFVFNETFAAPLFQAIHAIIQNLLRGAGAGP